MSLKEAIESCTSEENIEENWQKIMSTCDEISSAPDNKIDDVLKLIRSRLGHKNPNVQRQTVSLLTACVANCGKRFNLALCSRDTEKLMKKLLVKNNDLNPQVATELKKFLVSTEKEFASDPSLDLIRGIMTDLRSSGVDFSESGGTAPVTTSITSVTSPSSGQSAADLAAKEEADLKRAIEESLQASGGGGSSGTSGSSMYPSIDLSGSSSTTAAAPAVRTASAIPARVLYDFDATEENELTLREDEIIEILDSTDENWWNGRDKNGREGFFPASFVTTDLSKPAPTPPPAEPEPVAPPEPQMLSGEPFDQMMAVLQEVPAGQPPESHPRFGEAMQQCELMKPLLNRTLDSYSTQFQRVQALNDRWVEASASYETLMRHVHQRRQEQEEKLRRQRELLQARRAQEEQARQIKAQQDAVLQAQMDKLREQHEAQVNALMAQQMQQQPNHPAGHPGQPVPQSGSQTTFAPQYAMSPQPGQAPPQPGPHQTYPNSPQGHGTVPQQGTYQPPNAPPHTAYSQQFTGQPGQAPPMATAPPHQYGAAPGQPHMSGHPGQPHMYSQQPQ